MANLPVEQMIESLEPAANLFKYDELPGVNAEITTFKQSLQNFQKVLLESFSPDSDIRFLVAQRSIFTDAILSVVWQKFGFDKIDASLIAVGGYGRGELHPASDIDLLILLKKPENNETRSMLESLLTFFWDIGLEVGHSVRTLKECISEAKADITVATNLMESRLISGDSNLFEQMKKKTGPKSIWPSKAFFQAKIEEQSKRHHKYGDTAYNLEPNIKGNPGGLRDIQIIGWVAKRHFLAESMYDLVKHQFLTEEEYNDLRAGEEHLWKIRFALHMVTGRHEDRLLFDHQRKLAKVFGHEETEQNQGIEAFMQSYYRTVIKLNRLNEMLLQLFKEAILYRGFNLKRKISPLFRSINGFVEVKHPQVFAEQPSALLEIFCIIAENPKLKGVRASTIRLIRENLFRINDDFRADINNKRLFLSLFKSESGLTHALRSMNRYGVLEAYLPAFKNIVGRMQYDLFHVFTVDEHTLTLIRNLRRFMITEHREEFPLCTDIIQNLSMPWIVYLAGLFHDIAKGRGGDHAELGAIDALEFAQQHEMSAYEANNISWLVENHLLMSMTAQRKDIDDPDEILAFATKVADLSRLDYLYLLTVADSRATSPARWNDWKDSLLKQLYLSTRKAIIRGLDDPQGQDEVIKLKKDYAINKLSQENYTETEIDRLWSTLDDDYFLHSSPDEIYWQTLKVMQEQTRQRPVIEIRKESRRGGTEIFICTDDRENVFSVMTILLAQQGLKILSAKIFSAGNNCTMNSYIVHEQDNSYIETDSRRKEIINYLKKGLSEPDNVANEISSYVHRQIKHFAIEPEIVFQNDSRGHFTGMRLRASDKPGLLADVSQVFIRQKIKVHSAKIATVGADAEDTFLISNQDCLPLSEEQQQQLADGIKKALTN